MHSGRKKKEFEGECGGWAKDGTDWRPGHAALPADPSIFRTTHVAYRPSFVSSTNLIGLLLFVNIPTGAVAEMATLPAEIAIFDSKIFDELLTGWRQNYDGGAAISRRVRNYLTLRSLGVEWEERRRGGGSGGSTVGGGQVFPCEMSHSSPRWSRFINHRKCQIPDSESVRM